MTHDHNKAADEKYQAANRFLEGEYVLVHINPRAENVQLPLHLLQGNSVTLKLSRLFRGAMEVTTERITADLLFSGSYFTCTFPLAAIWGFTNDRGDNLIWPESTPKEVLNDILSHAKKKEPSAASEEQDSRERPKKLPSKGHLMRVK